MCVLVALSTALSGPGVPRAHAELSGALPSLEAVFPAVKNLSVPRELGEIQEAYQGKPGRTVILIQDAHAVYEAQKSIESLILYFRENYRIHLTGVEGGDGAFEPRLLQSYPDSKYLRRVLDEYLQRGELSGSVTAAVSAKQGLKLFGLEDRPLYEKAILSYLRAFQVKEENLKKISAFEKVLRQAKEKNYSPELLNLDRQDCEFWNGSKQNLAEYLELLTAAKLPAGYPHLSALWEEIQNSKKGTPAAAGAELEDLIRLLKAQALTREESRALNEKIQDYQTSQADLRSLSGFLLAMASEKGISIGKFSSLREAAKNEPLLAAMQGPAFFQELETFSREVKKHLAQGSPEVLQTLTERLRVLDRLVRLQLTSREWKAYRDSREDYSLDSLKAFLREVGESVSGSSDFLSLQDAEDFYSAAEARDLAFFEKIFEAMRGENADRFLFLAGGFHSEGLTALLKSAECSYVLVMPRIQEIPAETSYERAMRADVSWKEFFKLENGEVNLKDAFLRGAVRRLIKKEWGDERGAKIKAWRDEIIRRLASAGEIEKSGIFTRYLDELSGREGRLPGLDPAEGVLQALRRLVVENKMTPDNVLRLAGAAAAMPYTNINIGSISAAVMKESGIELSAQSGESSVPLDSVFPHEELTAGPRAELRSDDSAAAQYPDHPFLRQISQSRPWQKRLSFLTSILGWANPKGDPITAWYPHSGGDVLHALLASNAETLVMSDAMAFGEEQHLDIAKRFRLDVLALYYVTQGERTIQDYVSMGGDLRDMVLASLRALGVNSENVKIENLGGDRWRLSFDWRHPGEAKVRPRTLYFLGSESTESIVQNLPSLPEPLRNALRDSGGLDLLIEKGPNYYKEFMTRLEDGGTDIGGRGREEIALARVRIDAVNRLKTGLLKQGGKILGDHEQPDDWPSSNRVLLQADKDFVRVRKWPGLWLGDFQNLWGNGNLELAQRNSGTPDLLESLSSPRSELRSAEPVLGAFSGVTEKMPIVDFLQAFGIDLKTAVIEPVQNQPGFGRFPVSISQDTMESAASVFLSENVYREAKVYVRAVQEKKLETLQNLYLLTYQGRPAAFVWALEAPSEGTTNFDTRKTLVYPLLVFQQRALFLNNPGDKTYPPFPDFKLANSFYESVISPYLSKAHGTKGYRFNLNILDDPYHESPQSAMQIRRYGNENQGFAFPGSYSPWEHSTEYTLDILREHLLKKLGRQNLEGLTLADVGSGAGRVSEVLASMGASVEAYDLTLLKAMNTQAWARVNGLLEKVHPRKARSVTEIPPVDGYVVNFPNLNDAAPRFSAADVIEYRDSRELNIGMHPEDFRKVMEDLRVHAKPGAFLLIRGNFQGPAYEVFREIMIQTGWTDGLEEPLAAPEGVEPFGAAYFLRQGAVRSELRKNEEETERDRDLRERYERIIRQVSFGRSLEIEINQLLDALERPSDERDLRWNEVPGPLIDRLVVGLQSANPHYSILSPGTLKEGDHVFVFEVPGVGVQGLGQKELNALLGEEMVNRLAALKREIIAQQIREMTGYEKLHEPLYSTYKEDVFAVRGFRDTREFPRFAKRWGGPDGMLRFGDELQSRVVEEVTAALREPTGPFRHLLEKESSREYLAKKGILDIDKAPLFEVGYGVSRVMGKTASARLNADINAHQALTLSNLSGDPANRLFSNTRYRQQIFRIADLRENELIKQAPGGIEIFEGKKGARTLKLSISEVLRKRFPWTSLSSAQQALFGNDADYYAKAQRYFDFLRLQDYIKKWNVRFDRAVGEAIRIRATMKTLMKLRDRIDSNRLVSDRDAKSLQPLSVMLLNDPRMLSIASARWFHTVVSEMPNPVYVNFDVKGMGLMNVSSFELEIQAIEKEIAEHQRVTPEVERIWRSSADEVTEKVQGIEPIIRRVLRRYYQEAGLEFRSVPAMMGGDEVVFAVDGDVMNGERLDRFLFDVREEIQKTLQIDIRAGVSTRIHNYREHFRGHPQGDDVAHASLMIGIDSITAVLKSLEALEAKGTLDPAQRGAILFNENRDGREVWTGKVRSESGAIVSFDAGRAAGIARAELRADEAVRSLDIYEYYQEIVSELGLNAAEQAEISGILSDQYEHAFGFRSPQALVNLVELLYSPRTDERLLKAVQEFAAVPGLDDSLNVGDLFDENQIGHLLGYYFLSRIEEGSYETGGPYKVLNLALKTRVSTGGASPDGLVRNLRTRMNLLAEFKSVTSRERPQLSRWLKGYESQMKKYIRTVLTAGGPELYPPFLFHEAPSGVLWGVGNKLVQGSDGQVDDALRQDVNRRIQDWFKLRVKEVREDLKKRKVPVSEAFQSQDPVLEVVFFDQPELVRENPVQPNPQAMDAIRWERVYSRILELREKYKYELVGVPRSDVYKYFKIVDPVFYDEVEQDKENGQFRLYERYRTLGTTFRERERVVWSALHPDKVPPSAAKGGGVSARERNKVIAQASNSSQVYEVTLEKGMGSVPKVPSGVLSLGGLESRSAALARDHLQRFLFSFRAYLESIYPEGREIPGNFTAALDHALQTALRRGNQEDYLQPVFLSWSLDEDGIRFQVFDTARNLRERDPSLRNPHRLFSFEEAGIPYESSRLLTETSRIAANRISFTFPWSEVSREARSASLSYDLPDNSGALPFSAKVIFQNNPLDSEQSAMVFFPAEDGQQRYLELDLVNKTLRGFLLKTGTDGKISERQEYTHYEAVDPGYYAQITKALFGISAIERKQSREEGAVDARLLAVKWMIGRVFRQTEVPDVVEIKQRDSSAKIQVQFRQEPSVQEEEGNLKILFPYISDRRGWSGPLYVVTIPEDPQEPVTFNVYLRRFNESGDLVESEPLQPEPGIPPRAQDAYEFEDEVTGDAFKVSLFEIRAAFENWRSKQEDGENNKLLKGASGRLSEIFQRSEMRQELRSSNLEAEARVRELAVEMVAAVRQNRRVDLWALELAGLLAVPNRDELWHAFESSWTKAAAGTTYDREALRAFAGSSRLTAVLNRLAAQKTRDLSVLADLPEQPVAFAVGEKLIYQASLGGGPASSGDVKNVVRTSLENDGRLILASQASSTSAPAASQALDRALQELGGEVRTDRIQRLQTGAKASLSQFEDKLGKDFDVNHFVVFVERGDSEIEMAGAEEKKRGLVFVIDPEVLSLLSVSQVMRILKNLALVPERLREFYRDELGLRPDPQTGLTFIGKDFLTRLAHLADAEAQILASA